ncbi:unnamed protein product [Scytosiphon promiscuus]
MNVLRGAKNYVTGALGFSSGETSGALDIMVVQHEDGVMSCTPFHVRFSKLHTTNSKERVIQLRVNGRVVPLCMKLGAAGEAFFVERVHNPLRRDLATSPLSSPLQNYQLLSDLSSDEEASSYRERKPKSARRKHSRRGSRGTRAAGEAEESPVVAAEDIVRTERASTEASSTVAAAPWPQGSPAAPAAATEGHLISRSPSLTSPVSASGGASGLLPPSEASLPPATAPDPDATGTGDGAGRSQSPAAAASAVPRAVTAAAAAAPSNAGAGDAASGASLPAARTPVVEEDGGAADAAGGHSAHGAERPEKTSGSPSALPASPWIGRGGALGGDDGEAAMTICVAGVVTEEPGEGGAALPLATPPPADGSPTVDAGQGGQRSPPPSPVSPAAAAATAAAEAPPPPPPPPRAAAAASAEDGRAPAGCRSMASADGKSCPPEQRAARGIDQLLVPKGCGGTTRESVRVSEGDHLALAHLLLRAREDSSSTLAPKRCIFPGDEDSEMNEEVVAVERLSSDAEAWLTGGPTVGRAEYDGDGAGHGGRRSSPRAAVASSAAPSLVGKSSRSVDGSNVDLKGFHTPYGGSATDLTELSPAADGQDGMSRLLAEAAASLEPSDDWSMEPLSPTDRGVEAVRTASAGAAVGTAGGEEVNKWARDAFVKEAVTWEDFSRYPKEILQDPRLLVAMEGHLMSVPEALPHLIAASVFGHSLRQPSLTVPRGRAGSEGGSHLQGAGHASGDSGRERSGSASRIGGGSGSGGPGNDDDGASSPPTPSERAVASGSGSCSGGRGARGGAAPRAEDENSGVDAYSGGGGGSGDADAVQADGAEGAAGSYWGLSGWFSRRSGTSSPAPPLVDGSPVGEAFDRRRLRGSAAADRAAPEGGDDRRDGVATAMAAGRGKGSARRTRRSQSRTAPSPLSMEVASAGAWRDRGGGGDVGGGGGGLEAGYASETDEDEDLYGKTLRPTSEQLAALRLRAGCNTVEFVVRLAGQAERVVSARAFLWGSGAKVVVSDIENTIARSGGGAGMGSFSQVVGPGVHKDVSTLYSKISGNGYKILYLTNRPLPDWHAKKGAAAAAEGGLALPRGPVLCPPEVLFRGSSSHERRGHQEVFKMTALRGLKLIFPADVNPLYAGFGNSVSDMVAYKKMTVPEGRIFLINSMGELHNINHTYRQTYLSLSRHVDLTFPPLPHDGADDSCDDHHAAEDYEDEEDVEDSDYDGTNDHDRDVIDSNIGSNSNSDSGSAGGPRLLQAKSSSLSAKSFVAAAGIDGSVGMVADTADDSNDGGGAGGGGGGGAGAHFVSRATGGALAVGDEPESDGNMRTLGEENGRVGSGDAGRAGPESVERIGDGSRPASTKVTSRSGASGAAGASVVAVAAAAKLKTKAKTAALTPRKWEEVAPRREKSFYPNRAAVEDRFTDLNFWREPPPLIGDDDEDEDEDDGESQDEEEDDDPDDAEDKGNIKTAVDKKEGVDGVRVLENGAA